MDAVYVLGTGSRWQDFELLYSLRSLHEFVHGIDRVIVVGSKPRWLRNAIHIPYNDRHACKEANIMEKVLRACEIPDLSNQFLHLHDDHFCLFPCFAQETPYWSGRPLDQLAARLQESNYRRAIENTNLALTSRGMPNLNYDLHVPIVYDKKLFPAVMHSYDWNSRHGFVVKSLYANTVGVRSTPGTDLKLFNRYLMSELVEKLKGRHWWSIGPSSLNTNLKELLAELYPQPSLWE